MSDLTNADKRKYWMECITCADSEGLLTTSMREYLESEALRRYPDPKEPTIITTDEGWQYRFSREGVFQVRPSGTEAWHECYQCDGPRRITPSFAMSLGEIARESLEQEKTNGL